LAVAGCSILAMGVIASIAPPLSVPILIAAGFISVRIYRSKSMEHLTPVSGAALGAMTCFWPFLLEAAGTAVIVFTDQGRAYLKAVNNSDAVQFLSDPSKLIPTLIAFLLVGTVSGALGGALAARWQQRNGPSHE
jgi:hypothetical protein